MHGAMAAATDARVGGQKHSRAGNRSVPRGGARLGAGAMLPLLAALASVGLGAEKLDPLVVTGTRTAQRLSETPIRTELLTEADLRLAAPRNLADAIELLSGARVENNCQNCGTSEILLLGLEQKYTQLLFDSAPLFSGLAGVYGIEQIPAVFIDRIEVVKGGGSAVYGGGAVGGVINILGRRPVRSGLVAEARVDAVKGKAGTLFSFLADGVSRDGAVAGTVYGQRGRVEAVDLNADGFSDLTKRELDVAGARVVRRSAAGELRADVSRTVEFRRGGNKFELPDELADISERVDTKRDAVAVAWTGTPTATEWDYGVAAGFARIGRETFYGGLFGRGVDDALVPESAPGAGDNEQALIDRGYRTVGEVARDQFGFTKNRVWNVDGQVNRRWGAHQTSVGAQYFREQIADLVPVSAFVADYPVQADVATGDNVGVFLQDDWKLAERWQLVMGGRVDKNSELSRAVFSPRVNLKWQASEELTWRATWGAGFRAPQAFDEDLHIELIAGNRTRTVEASDLRQEKSQSALVSAEYQPEWAEGKLALEATTFLTRIRGTFTNSEVFVDAATGESLRWRYNGPNAEVGGVELNVGALPWKTLRVDVGYVGQFARFDRPVTVFDDGAGGRVEERNFLETPRHYGVLQVTWTEPRWAEVSVTGTYTGAMKEINQRTGELNGRTRDFVVWNAVASRRVPVNGWPAVVVSAGVKNAFDARQDDLERGVERDPYYLYGPRTPRTLFAAVRVEF